MLIVETGEGLKTANSYITLDEAKEYLTLRSVEFDEASIESKVILACDFLTFAGFSFKGEKTNFEQSLDFPRKNLFIGHTEISSKSVPQQVKTAQLELLKLRIESPQLFEVMSYQDFIVKEKIDVIETQYASPAEIAEVMSRMKTIDNILLPFIRGSGGQLKVYRG